MKFHNITTDDMLNGDGLRTVLWVSGCSHHCKGCQNPITWDPHVGVEFDEKAKEELFEKLEPDYISGLTLSGGDPLFEYNRENLVRCSSDQLPRPNCLHHQPYPVPHKNTGPARQTGRCLEHFQKTDGLRPFECSHLYRCRSETAG